MRLRQGTEARRPRILELVRSLDKGGRTVRILDGAAGLRRRGFDVLVGVFEEPAPWVRHRWPDQEVVHLGTLSGADPRYAWRIYRLLRHRRIDLLHTHSEDGYFYGSIAARARGIPSVGTFHRSRVELYRRDAKSALWNRLLTHQVAVSRNRLDLMVSLTRAPRRRASVIPGAADLDRFRFVPYSQQGRVRQSLGIPLDEPVLLGIGHLGEIKGHDLTIQALPEVLRHLPQARLYLAGVGEPGESQRLTGLAESLGVGERVRFLGQVLNPEEWLAACDVFVQPSRDEAFGLVFAEAGAVGRPVVSARVGGIPEVVLEGETGFLVEREDVSAIAFHVRKLLGDRSLRERLGEAGRARAEACFSIDALVSAYASLFSSLLSHRGLSPEAPADARAEHRARREESVPL